MYTYIDAYIMIVCVLVALVRSSWCVQNEVEYWRERATMYTARALLCRPCRRDVTITGGTAQWPNVCQSRRDVCVCLCMPVSVLTACLLLLRQANLEKHAYMCCDLCVCFFLKWFERCPRAICTAFSMILCMRMCVEWWVYTKLLNSFCVRVLFVCAKV